MNIYNVLEVLRRLVTWPFRLLILPIWIVLGFLLTDWSKYTDREYFKTSFLNLIKPI